MSFARVSSSTPVSPPALVDGEGGGGRGGGFYGEVGFDWSS